MVVFTEVNMDTVMSSVTGNVTIMGSVSSAALSITEPDVGTSAVADGSVTAEGSATTGLDDSAEEVPPPHPINTEAKKAAVKKAGIVFFSCSTLLHWYFPDICHLSGKRTPDTWAIRLHILHAAPFSMNKYTRSGLIVPVF